MENVIVNVLHFMILLSLGVILPIVLVWIVSRASINRDNRRAEILLKVLETDNTVDVDKLAEALSAPKKDPKQILANRILVGAVATLVGIAAIAADWIAGSFPSPFFVGGLIVLAIGLGFIVACLISRRQILEEESR